MFNAVLPFSIPSSRGWGKTRAATFLITYLKTCCYEGYSSEVFLHDRTQPHTHSAVTATVRAGSERRAGH